MMLHEAALARAMPGTGDPIDFTGRWVNELSSIATLEQSGDALAGSYESAVSSDGARTSGALVGWVDGDLIAFTVHWNDFQAITSWVGQLVPTGDASAGTISTLWQMTKQVDPGDEWASINAGADTFMRMPEA